MIRRILLGGFIAGLMVTVNAETIDLHGTVSNRAGEPIEDAIVTLKGQAMIDTTESDGIYSFSTITAVNITGPMPRRNNVFMRNGNLVFSLPEPSSVTVQIFDVSGTLLKKEYMPNMAAGFHHFNVMENRTAARLLVIKATLGKTTMTFRYLPLSNCNYTINSTSKAAGISVGSHLAGINEVNDTLTVSADGYVTKSVEIDSYEQQLDITLDAEGGDFTGSVGCGKDLGSLTSGRYTISSAGLSREYVIDIPPNYDKDKPYRLIFGMHCMGSSADGVVSENYYSLKPLANSANIPCIFVAPQGYTDGSPWRVSDNKDHVFFSDMLELFKGELCVDTTRIFCCGFSYGAMVTYSLSTDFQKQLRAVATYAPANWNIYLPENAHEPIAYMQTTGKDDNLCSWVNSDAARQGGKYCVLQHIEDNGCTVPDNIPLANTNNHISTEFDGCQEGYPVKFCSFLGGHQGTASDGGSSENWIAKETWEFFMRF